MPDLHHPTRLAILDAALDLFDRSPMSRLSMDEVVKAAGVAKGTLYNHFEDRTAFLAALHDRFHDGLREEIDAASASLPPGAAHLQAGTLAYLDGCRARKGVKAMLADMRAEPVIAEKVAQSNFRFAEICAVDFNAMGHVHPLATAQLYVAAVAEIALLELRDGHTEHLREALAKVFYTTP